MRSVVRLVVLLALPAVLVLFLPTPVTDWHDPTTRLILTRIRLPMLLLALTSGAVLAGGGVAFQALFRNPLATPYTLGLSSGAAFGAVSAILLGMGSGILLPVFAFLGALLSMGLVVALAARRRQLSTLVVLLAGVAVNFLFASIIMFLQYAAGQFQVFRMTRWLLGGLNGASLVAVIITGVAAMVLFVALYRMADGLDLLVLGDDLAASRGLALRPFKVRVILVVSITVACAIAFVGPVGFIGIVVPHMARIRTGPLHRRLLPAAMVGGGVLLALCDLIGRTVIYPAVVPTGVMTALIGAPFFLWILLGRSGNLSR